MEACGLGAYFGAYILVENCVTGWGDFGGEGGVGELAGELFGDLWFGLDNWLVCGGFGGFLPGWVPGCRKPARCCRPVLSGTRPCWMGWCTGCVGGVVSITCRGEFGEERRTLRVSVLNVRSTMGETKFALYLGAVLSTLLRVFTYLFLRVVSISLLFLSPRCIFGLTVVLVGTRPMVQVLATQSLLRLHRNRPSRTSSLRTIAGSSFEFIVL